MKFYSSEVIFSWKNLTCALLSVEKPLMYLVIVIRGNKAGLYYCVWLCSLWKARFNYHEEMRIQSRKRL